VGGPSKNSTYWSVQCSHEEKAQVDAAAKEAGLSRNAFVRQWIASLVKK
jgi:predicted HicB family RNase H-like nuclease